MPKTITSPPMMASQHMSPYVIQNEFFMNTDPSPPCTPSSNSLIRITLSKPMGIVFEPIMTEGKEQGVRICELSRAGAAALSQQLEVGDELLSINDETMSRRSFDKIMDFIIRCNVDKIDLLFRRPRGKKLKNTNINSFPTPEMISESPLRDDALSCVSDETELISNLSNRKTLRQKRLVDNSNNQATLSDLIIPPPPPTIHNKFRLSSKTNLQNLSIRESQSEKDDNTSSSSSIVNMCQTPRDIQIAFRKIHESSTPPPPSSSTRKKKHHHHQHPPPPPPVIPIESNGTEYAVDIVSHDGMHKIAALWQYDKRDNPNGSSIGSTSLCPVGTILADATSAEGQKACDVATRALGALGVSWGMSRCTVLVEDDGGVDDDDEGGSSCRFREFTTNYDTDLFPLTTACVGYNSLDMVFVSYAEKKNVAMGDNNTTLYDHAFKGTWDDLPRRPGMKAWGGVLYIVCHVEGKVVGLKGVEDIEELSSVLAMEIYPQFLVGNYVTRTTDQRTRAGWLRLVNVDKRQFEKDYEAVLKLMPFLFIIEHRDRKGSKKYKNK